MLKTYVQYVWMLRVQCVKSAEPTTAELLVHHMRMFPDEEFHTPLVICNAELSQ
jgi:hypothetical protein